MLASSLTPRTAHANLRRCRGDGCAPRAPCVQRRCSPPERKPTQSHEPPLYAPHAPMDAPLPPKRVTVPPTPGRSGHQMTAPRTRTQTRPFHYNSIATGGNFFLQRLRHHGLLGQSDAPPASSGGLCKRGDGPGGGVPGTPRNIPATSPNIPGGASPNVLRTSLNSPERPWNTPNIPGTSPEHAWNISEVRQGKAARGTSDMSCDMSSRALQCTDEQ